MLQAAETAPAGSRPNVIFILTDDQGWGDARFSGHPYVKTPNLDRFAAEGTWFKQFYVASTVCSPSRAAFMTGRFPARDQIHAHISGHALNAARFMPDWLDHQVPTITRLLQQAGYATGHFGKWHLGSGDKAPLPGEYGIDDHRTTTTVPGAPTWDDANTDAAKAKSTTQIVDETIRFIRAHRAQPFYVNVWTRLPHAPLLPTAEQLEPYQALRPRADDPAFGLWMQKYLAAAKNLDEQMRIFCAALTDIDTQVGRLLRTLDELGVAENTIIFFSSDNGPEDYRIANAANAGVGSAGPLRARKRSMYEGGIRTFGVLRWPGRVPAGRVDDQSVIGAVDWLPTICKLAGVTPPPEATLDGEDVSDIWLGQSRPRLKPLCWEWLFNVQGAAEGYMPPMLAMREGQWKLFASHDGSRAELYDIAQDAGEEHDLASQRPEVVKELTAKLLAWQQSLPPSKARELAAATGKPIDARQPAKKTSTAPSDKPKLDRAATFKKKDTNQDGKLSLEEYLHKFPDEAEGRRRFPKFDTDQNGVLSEEEFVKAGRP
ncbi:MAG: sulfatase-like hydrolase/transferase [Planctomycetota bacterium]